MNSQQKLKKKITKLIMWFISWQYTRQFQFQREGVYNLQNQISIADTSERFAPLARITNGEIVQKVFIFWAVSFFWGVWGLWSL